MYKFNYIIGNPPYQLATGVNDDGRVNYTKIYDKFQELGLTISMNSAMIYPSNWKNSPQNNFANLLIDYGLMSLMEYSGDAIFGPAIRKDYPVGIVIIRENYQGNISINSISNCRNDSHWIFNLDVQRILEATKNYPKMSLSLYDISTLTSIEADSLTVRANNNYENSVKLYIKERRGAQPDGRDYYINRDNIINYVVNPIEIDLYNVAVQCRYFKQAQAIRELLSDSRKTFQVKVFSPGYIFSKTWINIRSFDNGIEANNFAQYLNSRIIVLLLSQGTGKRSFGKFVPDLNDYSNNNELFMGDDELGKEHEYYGLSLNDRLHKYFNIRENYMSSSSGEGI